MPLLILPTLTNCHFLDSKFLAYLAAHKSRQHTDRFGFHNLRVLTITSSAERVASMRAAVSEITNGKGGGMFLFADAVSLAEHGDPLTLPWITTAGTAKIDEPPRSKVDALIISRN